QNSVKSLNVETNTCNCNNIITNETDFCLNVETNAAKEASKEETEEVELKQKFKLEFMVDPEFMKKLERIKSRLSRKYPEGINFEKLFSVVMDEYLERHSPEKRIEKREERKADWQKVKAVSRNNQRTRNIPAAARDKVYKRNGGKCAFVGKDGKRCNSTWNLEIDHKVPFAKGGDNSLGNLRLLCAKHNRLEAERAYGKDFMKKYIKRE
ncbi:HNH endonuclease, partial [bacterium]|nr:HNH endonuclease [bacterium]